MIHCVTSENSVRVLEDSKEIFTVYEKLTDAKTRQVTVSVEGNLRSDAVAYIEEELYSLLLAEARITVDLDKVLYVSTTAQQAFLRIQQKAESMGDGYVSFHIAEEKVYAAFVKTGLADLLLIER